MVKWIVRLSSATQLWFILHPGFISRFVLRIFYVVDLVIYSVRGPNITLGNRRKYVGNNYCLLGRLLLGEYDPVAKIILNPQQRKNFVGRAAISTSRMSPYFLLFLSDEGAGGNGDHKIIRKALWDTVIGPAFTRTTSQQALNQIEKITTIAAAMGKNPDAKKVEPDLQKMILSYMMWVLFEVQITEQQQDSLVRLAFSASPFTNMLASTILPFAPPNFLLRTLRKAEEEVIALIMGSPALASYTPAPENLNMDHQAFGRFLLSIIMIPASAGGSNAASSVISKIPTNYVIDPNDKALLSRCVLEIFRISPPVNNVNLVSQEPLDVTIRGTQYQIPAGTLMAASVGSANHDASVFPNPENFDPNRDNLVTHSLNFNSVDGQGRRKCPGRNIAMAMCVDILASLRRKQDSVVL